MKLSTIRRILKEDLARSGETPNWLDALLTPLNDFINQAVSAFGNNLTFRDNFLSTEVTQSFTSGVTAEVNPQKTARVRHVFVGDPGGKMIKGFGWERRINGNINVFLSFTEKDGTTAVTSPVQMILVIMF